MPLVSRTFDQLIDFTRTSSATFVGSNGLIQTTPQSRNLLTFTQEFDNAAWTKVSATVAADAGVAPDGTASADNYVPAAGTVSPEINRSVSGLTNGSAYTYSVYLKDTGSGSGWFEITLLNPLVRSFFDIRNGVKGVGAGSIQNVGGGWYRCSVPTTLNTTTTILYVTPRSADGNSGPIVATAVPYALIWGAQLEQASTATTYTRNFGGLFPPRFDYDPMTLAPRGLLIEEQRTNLLLRSEEFDNASWTKTTTTATADATTAPSGSVTADSLVPNSAAALNTSVTFQQITKAASAIAYTYSVFVKANGFNRALLRCQDSGGVVNRADVTVSLTDGSIVTAAAATGTFTAASAVVASFGSGWYRVSLSFTSSTDTALRALVFVQDSVATTGDGTSGIYLWGAQLEAGAFATSYIPTVASQVTRTADAALIQAPNFAPWYRQDAGTFVVEAAIPAAADGVVGNYYFAVGDGTASNQIAGLDVNGTRAQIIVGGVAGFDSTVGAEPTGVVKFALAYSATSSILCASGVLGTEDTSVTLPSVNRLAIGMRNDVNPFTAANGHIRSIRYYPVRLSNAQLQALTA